MRVILSLLVFLLSSGTALAHPHQYIDYSVRLYFDDAKLLKALEQTWSFDPFYTELSLPDFDTNKNKFFDAEELKELAKQNLLNLKDFDYFTVIEREGKTQIIANADFVSTEVIAGRITLTFRLQLGALVPVPFTYSIYDPSYYVEMKHTKEKAITFVGADCKADVAHPEPNAVYVALAQSLDKNATAPDNLGRNFAETVAVTCP